MHRKSWTQTDMNMNMYTRHIAYHLFKFRLYTVFLKGAFIRESVDSLCWDGTDTPIKP